MNTRLVPIVAFAAIFAVSVNLVCKAQINPFSAYYDNVARAARQGDAAQVRLLVANDGNPNQTDEEARTAMHYGAMNGNLTIIAILVKAKAKLDAKDKLGNTPLHLAADRNQVDAAQLLLDVGAPVDAENKNSMTPLAATSTKAGYCIASVSLRRICSDRARSAPSISRT